MSARRPSLFRRPMIAAVAVLTASVTVVPAGVSARQPHATPSPGYWGPVPEGRLDEACLDRPEPDRSACRRAVLREQSFAVIALIDTGINPYHPEFRAPEFTVDPAEYISGYPSGATAIEISPEVEDPCDAPQEDLDRFAAVESGELAWIPGTRIVGAVSIGGDAPTTSVRCPSGIVDRPIIDDSGHGTMVAGAAAGRRHGSAPRALVVSVEARDLDAALAWVADQPWIDVVSNSWGSPAHAPLDQRYVRLSTRGAELTRRMVEDGKVVLFAAGNGLIHDAAPVAEILLSGVLRDPVPVRDQNLTSPYAGPSWVVTVGAASPHNGQSTAWHSAPADVVSFGTRWRSAHVSGAISTCGGTSCASPIVAGVVAETLRVARTLAGDHSEGPRGGNVAVRHPSAGAPPSGPLSDGLVTRRELEATVLGSARPVDLEMEDAPQDWSSWVADAAASALTDVGPACGEATPSSVRDCLVSAARWLDGRQHSIPEDLAVWPTTPVSVLDQGYGLVDRAALDRAVSVITGAAVAEERPLTDAWFRALDGVRDAIWGGSLSGA